MTIHDTLRNMLQVYDIDISNMNNDFLDTVIYMAKQLINRGWVQESRESDYDDCFNGKVYITNNYPVLPESEFELYINNEKVTPQKITRDGIVYLDKNYQGILDCVYTVGLPEEDYNNTILPIAVFLLRDSTKNNINSIAEGDVNISYTGDYSIQIQQLISNIQNKYSGRVRVL